MPGLVDLPGNIQQIQMRIPTAATAVTALIGIGQAMFKSTVASAYFVPDTAQTGAATNNRQLDVVNGGAAGAGTAVPSTITYTNAVNATAATPNTLTTATDSTANVAAGDFLYLSQKVNGTGLPALAGTIVVNLKSRLT